MKNELSNAYIRRVIKSHVGNVPISEEAIKIVREYLNGEAHRIAEAGVKEFLTENELRMKAHLRQKHRLSQHEFLKVVHRLQVLSNNLISGEQGQHNSDTCLSKANEEVA